jgi:transposase-like protein
MENCPKCNHTKIIKNGFACGQQRYKCKACNYQFTQISLERGKPLWMKLEAILLYMSGMSMNAIGKHLNVSAQAILNWVREFAEKNKEKPTPGKAVVIELDEMWHFIESKKQVMELESL